MNDIGTAPCVFELNSSFYDFTPFKVAYDNPQAPYVNGNILVTKT